MAGRFVAVVSMVSAGLLLAQAGCGDDSSTPGSGGAGTTSTVTGATGATSTTGAGSGGSGDGGSGPTTTATGTGGGGVGGSVPMNCDGGPFLGQGPDCVACQTENCCINAAGCLADEACAAVEACTLENNTVSDCVDQNPDAIWYVSGVVICRQNNCADVCNFPQATCGNIIPSPQSCTDAIQAACCEETTACGENDACVAFIYQCIDANECTTQDCYDECLAQYPDAADDFNTMADCWATVTCP